MSKIFVLCPDSQHELYEESLTTQAFRTRRDVALWANTNDYVQHPSRPNVLTKKGVNCEDPTFWIHISQAEME